jgi:hypothetical protein
VLGEVLRHLACRSVEVVEQRLDPGRLPFSTLAMRSFGNRVSVPWQIRLVIMSAISRCPSTVQRNALISMKLLVVGGSHLSMYSSSGGWLACRTIGSPASSTSRQNGSNSGSAGDRQPRRPFTGAGLISATLAPLSRTYSSSRWPRRRGRG